MTSRWGGGERPRSNLNRADELRRILEDEWRTRRRLYPRRTDSDVTPLGCVESGPPTPADLLRAIGWVGQGAARSERSGDES